MNIIQTLKHTASATALLALLGNPSSGMACEDPGLTPASTPVSVGKGPASVNLRSAGSFVILSKTGITDVYASSIVGNVGTSPITGAALLLACDEVVGTMYTVDAAGPACKVINPAFLTTSIGDMQTAYTDAAGRTLPDATELGAGNINGMIVGPGLYKWSSSVLIPARVTLNGGPNDVWIFQIAGNLTVGNGAMVTLSGGAQAKNIYWQVAGQTTLGTTANFKGVVLCKTLIAMKTGAVLTGRALAQTAVTLQMNAVIEPAN
jgi:hypothetical protein